MNKITLCAVTETLQRLVDYFPPTVYPEVYSFWYIHITTLKPSNKISKNTFFYTAYKNPEWHRGLAPNSIQRPSFPFLLSIHKDRERNEGGGWPLTSPGMKEEPWSSEKPGRRRDRTQPWARLSLVGDPQSLVFCRAETRWKGASL